MPVTKYTPQADTLRELAFYSHTTDPEYVYLPDPDPDADEHVSDRHRPWSMLQEHMVQKYNLVRLEDPYDAKTKVGDHFAEIKSCVIRDEGGQRGKFNIPSAQHHRLRPDDEYIFVVYDQPDEAEREPHAGWWFIQAYVRLPAARLHAQFRSDFNRTSRASDDRQIVRKRISWTRIPEFTPARVRTHGTVDCTPFITDD